MTDKTAVEAMASALGELITLNPPNDTVMLTSAQVTLDALKANGFAVVPVEVSEAMAYKGLMALHGCGLGVVGAGETDIHYIYRAMIAAAQGGE